MQIVLIGADFEENLGLGIIAASLASAGHEVAVVPFNHAHETLSVVRRTLSARPQVVGLSIQFQHRAHDFLSLARCLRREGFHGHLTCGGQFPTMAHRELLLRHPEIDSVVLHDGEQTVVELAAALGNDHPLEDVAGIALRSSGKLTRTANRTLPEDLDALPFPLRYRPHSLHAGVPFIPISGGRGCWGSCSFCSITSFYRDARKCGGGKTLRLRSPENIAAEMAVLSNAVARPAVFCFHDDNFLLPRPSDSVLRIGTIRQKLDEFGVGKAGFVGKCRPDTVTQELATQLAALGVVRMYVGVENASEAGAVHLNRRTGLPQVRDALDSLRRAGIFTCYNLLLFEPDASLEDVRDNIAFMRDHAAHPVNFCRAEPYHRTPLHERLASEGRLSGSYLGWDYRILDDRAELLFRICAAAFRDRNFGSQGVANRYMGIGYAAKLVDFFYSERPAARAGLLRRAHDITTGITLETASLLEEALHLAQDVDLEDRERIERETALLGLRIAACDRRWHLEMDEFHAEIIAFVSSSQPPAAPPTPSRKLRELMQSLALASCLGIGIGCGGNANVPAPGDASTDPAVDTDSGDSSVVDPLPPDGGIDPLPEDSGVDDDSMVADPPPPDAGLDGDAWVVDPPPEDAGLDDVWVADPPPADGGIDPLPEDASVDVDAMVADPAPPDGGFAPQAGNLGGTWRQTAPQRSRRSPDLPLFAPPNVRLVAVPHSEALLVRLVGGPQAVSLRWESEGVIEGVGREVLWTPASQEDQLSVAVRSAGGVAVTTIRASTRRRI